MINKTILMGRITKDPETRYSQGNEPMAISRYTLAVNRRFKKDGQPEADFINIIAFGKNGEFAEKWFKKGMQVAVVGRIQTGSYTDKDGNKRYTTDVVVEEQHFAESKRSYESYLSATDEPAPPTQKSDGFVSIDDPIGDLPF